MTALPKHITERFYKILKGDISVDAFEQWLYADKELEKYLPPEDYLDLISLSFKKSGARHELWKLLRKHIDLGAFETYKMLDLLREAQQNTARLPYILIEFYNLYCKGYRFLQNLGIDYGLSVEVPLIKNTTAETWEELTTNQQKKLINSFSPDLEEEIDRIINWIEIKKIILTGEQDDLGHYDYEDKRTAKEKEPTL